jgi:transposase-like protein
MGGTDVSKSQISRLCEEIDGKVKAFLDRTIEGDWPYLWIDATYVKQRVMFNPPSEHESRFARIRNPLYEFVT